MGRTWIKKRPCRYTDEQLVDHWLSMHRNTWFAEPTNGFYGMEQQFRGIAEYWLSNGKHGPDYNNPRIIKAQTYWDEFLEMFEPSAPSSGGGSDE